MRAQPKEFSGRPSQPSTGLSQNRVRFRADAFGGRPRTLSTYLRDLPDVRAYDALEKLPAFVERFDSALLIETVCVRLTGGCEHAAHAVRRDAGVHEKPAVGCAG